MAQWRIVYDNAGVRAALPQWSDLTFHQSIGAPDTLVFNMPGDEEVVNDLIERETDLLLYRKEDETTAAVKKQRFRLLELNDDLDEAYTVGAGAASYEQLLASRYLHIATTYTDEEQAQIVWQLIQYTQGLSQGALGITAGTLDSVASTITGDVTITRIRHYDVEDEIGKLIWDLSNVINGFDWWIDADLKVNVVTPRRTRAIATPLEYQSNVKKLSRRSTSGTYRNFVSTRGDDSTEWVSLLKAGSSGRWEMSRVYNDVREQATVADKAAQLLDDLGDPRASFVATLSPGAWGTELDLELGDVLPLRARRGRLSITDLPVRVMEISISATPDGGEEVTLGLLQEP